jgi:hypothetical protein
MIFRPRMYPKTAQDRLKTDPRGSRRPSFLMLNFVFNFGPFWAPFCTVLGGLLGTKIDPKSIPKSIKNEVVPTYPHKTAPTSPKTPPRGPETFPRGLKTAARGPQDPPKRPQERPKTAQDPSKWLQERLHRPQEAPRTPTYTHTRACTRHAHARTHDDESNDDQRKATQSKEKIASFHDVNDFPRSFIC